MVFSLFGKKQKKTQKDDFLPEYPEQNMGVRETTLFSETDLSQIRELVAGQKTQTELPPMPIQPVKPANMPPAPPTTVSQKPMESAPVPPIQSEVRPIKEEKEERIEEKPEIYIKIDKYKQVMETLDKLILKTKELDSILSELERIKDEESKTLDNWRQQLEEVKSKINLVLEVLKE